jgi:hypothetical protein
MESWLAWIKALLWPDVVTGDGAARARLIGAAAILWMASSYSISFFYGIPGISRAAGEAEAAPSFYMTSLILGGIATAYLAARIRDHGCQLAAWSAFLWFAYQTVDAILEMEPSAPLLGLLTFASFQGLRGCLSSAEIVQQRGSEGSQ